MNLVVMSFVVPAQVTHTRFLLCRNQWMACLHRLWFYFRVRNRNIIKIKVNVMCLGSYS